jgi:hypothetical protein
MEPERVHKTDLDFSSKPIRIVPDANVLFADPFFQSVAAKTIVSATQFMEIVLVIGEVTLDEVRNIVNEQLRTIVSDLGKVANKAKTLNLETGIDQYGLGYNLKQASQAWEKRWEVLKKESVSMPYPSIDPREIALRSITEHRPFLRGDKGFRDYLLWISILAALPADDYNYILVSNDNGFYAENSAQLHSDLEKELASLSLSGRVLARKSLLDVIDEFIKPRLKPDQIVEVAIKSGKISDFTDADDKVDILINEYLMTIDIPEEWITKYDYYATSFDVAEDVAMTDLVSTLELDDKVLATSEWEASVVIEVSAYGYQDESETVFVSFKVESILDPRTLEVESHEVTGYELLGWYDPKSGERIPH